MKQAINHLGAFLFGAITLALFFVTPANAHRTGESYVYLNITESGISGRIEARAAHIAKVIDLDDNGDGKISKEEVTAHKQEIFEYFAPRLKFYGEDATYNVTFTDQRFFGGGQFFALLDFEIPELGAPPEYLDVEYEFLFNDADPIHRGFLIIESNTESGISENEAQHSLIFGPGDERQTFRVAGPRWHEIFTRFIGQGVYHIVPIGYDHILFLISLLLPSVLLLSGGKWKPAPNFRAPFMYVVKIVSIFTVAHTITLSLAALGLVRVPSGAVEAIIALSIAIVALNNIKPFLHGRTWLVVFVLGLFHGFGFANVLAPLGAGGISLVTALAGFNIGVEIGQLIVVGSVFPILYFLRGQTFYKTVILHGGSAVLIAIAMFWFVERVLGILTSDRFQQLIGG